MFTGIVQEDFVISCIMKYNVHGRNMISKKNVTSAVNLEAETLLKTV